MKLLKKVYTYAENQSELQKLIDKDKYQVFILMSSAALPFITFHHPWLVINEKGNLSRFEIRHTHNKDRALGYLHIDAQEFFQGLPLFYGFNHFFQPTKLIKLIEGDDNSLANRIVEFIKDSPKKYELLGKYSFLGPNCGTYVEWVIDNFPETDVKLPWTAIGKNYFKKV